MRKFAESEKRCPGHKLRVSRGLEFFSVWVSEVNRAFDSSHTHKRALETWALLEDRYSIDFSLTSRMRYASQCIQVTSSAVSKKVVAPANDGNTRCGSIATEFLSLKGMKFVFLKFRSLIMLIT